MAKCENCGHNSGFHWKQDGTEDCCLVCQQHSQKCKGFKGVVKLEIRKRYEIQYRDIKLNRWMTIEEHSTEFWQVGKDTVKKLRNKNPFIDWRLFDVKLNMEVLSR